MAEYLNNLPDYLYLLFVEEEVDKRSKMFKTVKQIGRVVDFAVQDEKTLMRWVLGIMKREGKQITQRDMEHFLSKTGTDMSNIEKELEKLLCYTMDRSVITGEDIDAVCTTQINNRIFAMVQAVAEQNQKKALDLYYDLLVQSDKTEDTEDENGTFIFFEPDNTLFKNYSFHDDFVETMLRNYTYLNTGLTIMHNGRRILSRHGLKDLLGLDLLAL